MTEVQSDDRQSMLADMASGVFAELGPHADFARDWSKIEELGFATLLVPEERDGFGGSWIEAGLVMRLAGQHAVALPIVESVLASYWADRAGWHGEGFGTIAGHCDGELLEENFTGTLSAVPWGRNARFVVAETAGDDGIILATEAATVTERTGLSGEPRDILTFENAPATMLGDSVLLLAAAVRAIQIAGALDGALSLAANYVSERQQFGRPLAKFQAVQQSLAEMAMEAAAAGCAAQGLTQALDRGSADFEIAAAKTRCGMAASKGAAIAHQVHGAIGFTEEYALHHLTRRLLAWRSEFGGESVWSKRLGQQVVDAGADRLWPDLVERTDP
ncbi:acyl-CoA dehydrogenase family protein [Altererythrobacter sp. MF3-039]|uniref:acyl-CoA dehydrogenase family protein n=1 Tax=Altererythrobacter sp. MF3-039 TaxID=3252901 RepID=UPI00390C8DEB